jgi:hypothetical protein
LNITRNTESTAVWDLKPEGRGSAVGQDKYHREKDCDRRDNNMMMIIIIIKFIIS